MIRAVVDRIALALYEPATDRLKTYISSNTDELLLKRYEVELSQVPSLVELVRERRSRVVADIPLSFTSNSTHTNWLTERGYRASYTTPMFQGQQLAAFLFFDTFADLIAQLFLLDGEEWAIMKQHVAIGEQIIDKIAAEMDIGDSLPFDLTWRRAQAVAFSVSPRASTRRSISAGVLMKGGAS